MLFISCVLFPAVSMASTQSVSTYYLAAQNGKHVLSRMVTQQLTSNNEKFSITVMRGHTIVDQPLVGLSTKGNPLTISRTRDTSYIATANPKNVKNGTVSAGDSFVLTAMKNNCVQFVGSVTKLIRITTHVFNGETIQTPDIHQQTVNDTIHLVRGHSMLIPVGRYTVRVTRM